MIRKLSLLLLSSLALSGAALAQIVNVPFTGNTSWDGWQLDNFNYGNNNWNVYKGYYGGYPGTNAWNTSWNNSAPSSLGSAGHAAQLYKVANGASGGGPYIGGESLYFGAGAVEANSLGGTIGIRPVNMLSGVRTIGFQIDIGEASGYDLFSGPTLFVTSGGSTVELDANFTFLISQVYTGTFTPPGEPEQDLYRNTYYFQWSVDATINSFEIQFSAVPHAQVYEVRLDQTDTVYNYSVVPEPSTWALLLTSGAAGVFALRRRRTVQA